MSEKDIVKWFNRNAKKGQVIGIRTVELAEELNTDQNTIRGVLKELRDEKGWIIRKMDGPPVYWLVMKPPLLGAVKEKKGEKELVGKE